MGKVFNTAIIAGITWGLFFLTGCDENRKAEPPAPKLTMISKPIAPPKAADPSSGPKSGIASKKTSPGSSLAPADAAPTKTNAKSDGLAEPVAKKMVSSPAPVTEDQVKREQDQAMAALGGTPLFRSHEKYDTKGRVDPFIPLLTEKKDEVVPSGNGEADQAPKRILTPLEKMDLSQIKLVAVIQRSKGAMAMVEEASGKGYEVHVGTYMGRNGGRVSAIDPDGLIIKEYYRDFQGKRRERIQEIKFHKNEGGQ